MIPKDVWWIRGFDFPRIQITLVTIVTLVAFLLLSDRFTFRDNLFVAALVLSSGYQLFMMSKYTGLRKKQVQGSNDYERETRVSLFCTNIQMENRNSEKLKELIRKKDPDILLAIETNDWWIEELKEFEHEYSFTVKRPQDNMYGMALYSRLELINPEVKYLVQDDIPSIHTKAKLPSGIIVELRCLHPRPPFPAGKARTNKRDAELLIVGKEIKDIDSPTIVMGDMNDVAWSRTNNLFQKISGLLDPRVGRGFFNTYHARYPYIRFPLDHLFHTKHFRLLNFERLDYIGSDHFPVFVELSFEPDANYVQEELEAEESKEEEAEEKIEEETDSSNTPG